MKILLSSSVKHFDPLTKTVKIRHSVGVLVELFSQVLEELGDVTYIGDENNYSGGEFDLIVSWPRNFHFLTTNNKFKKSVCFFNIAEASYLKTVLHTEAARLGCRVSDCFTPSRYYHADLNFLIGNDTVIKQYTNAGVSREKIIRVSYRHGYIPFLEREKNKKPVFLHVATTLGLRKGFWHVVNDFRKADIDAELWCVGKIQNEKFWIDFAKEVGSDPRIKVKGWIPNDSPEYVKQIHGADFVVFPSFGEGQPGTVIEAMEGGCIPLTTSESGIDYSPLGVYERGDTDIWKRAVDLSSSDFKVLQKEVREIVDRDYDNEVFKSVVRASIGDLIDGN